MRIPSGTTDHVKYFVAIDDTDHITRKTGVTGFTVYRSRNGGTATAMTTPTVAEVDATNMPGVYTLLMDEDMTVGAGNDSEEMIFHITASGMDPVSGSIELYRHPLDGVLTSHATAGTLGKAIADIETDAAAILVDTAEIGAAGAGLTEAGGTGNHLTAINLPNQTMDITGNLSGSVGSVTGAVGSVTAGVTVTTNNDKTGYRLSATGVDDVLDEVYEGTTTLRQFLRLAASAMWGKLSGAATTTVAIRDEADTKARITATVDADGNRSAVTLDKT